MSIPLDALDPDAHHREWRRSFEYHLDIVPAVLDVIVMMTLPSIQSSRFDKVLVTGGGYIDTMSAALASFDQSTNAQGVAPSQAIADARLLWWWLTDYTRAAGEWITPTRPAPPVDERVNADPLTARAQALHLVGWLIDHAGQLQNVPELETHTSEMLAEIRHLRGKYGVHATPRRPRERCTVCGERAVVITWIDGANGSPKPVQVGKCRTCGETYIPTKETT